MHTNKTIKEESICLTSAEAEKRLKAEGYNELPKPDQRNFLRIFIDILRQPMFALLIGGGLVYMLLGDIVEALVLLLFACLSIAITIIQESRSEHVLEALRNLASPRALVIRDGQRTIIAGREVVREDIIIVNEGDRVAADATLISSQELLLDESLLTGESIPVQKSVLNKLLSESNLPFQSPLGIKNSPFIFAGTLVVRGTGQALVNATGARTEMGKIGHSLNTIKTEQPNLQLQIKSFVLTFAIVGAIVGILAVVLFGYLRGDWLQALLGGIALGMSLLPEEFPLVMTVFMAMGAWRISRARVLTRQASAIETLGATTILCSDKTGTLTENKMSVIAIVGEQSEWHHTHNTLPEQERKVLEIALLACQQQPTDPMDIAIHQLVNEKLASFPSAFSNKQWLHAYGIKPNMFAVANIYLNTDGESFCYAKGAVESISKLCQLSDKQRTKISQIVDVLAKKGVRILAIAKAKVDSTDFPESINALQFEYVGLIGFADPLRKNVPAAIMECRSAGIKVMMITGDYPATAQAIGIQAGLDASNVLSGDEIETLSNQDLTQKLKSINIFARIQPHQKLRIVECLKACGEIVAMTGDGVNDAPAIKAAHIGIAMGGRGTDVAREASTIVLLDDDFDSFVKTISLGRRIYDNLRKAIEYIIAVHIPIAGLALLPLALGMPLLLTPIHIAFLEMLIDPACSIVFEAERAEKDVMQRPPRPSNSPLLMPRQIVWATVQGSVVLMLLSAVFIYQASIGMPEDHLRALIFTMLILMNIGLILINRSYNASLMEMILRPNRALWVLVSFVMVFIAIALFWSPAQQLFHFGQLQLRDYLICVSVTLLGLFMLEILKSNVFNEMQSD